MFPLLIGIDAHSGTVFAATTLVVVDKVATLTPLTGV